MNKSMLRLNFRTLSDSSGRLCKMSKKRLRRIFSDSLPTQDHMVLEEGCGDISYDNMNRMLWKKLLGTDEFSSMFNEVKMFNYGTGAKIQVPDRRFLGLLFRELTGGPVFLSERPRHRDPSPYEWLENRLQDGRYVVRPEVFFFALKKSTELTERQYPNHGYVIHPECLRQALIPAAEYNLCLTYEELPWTKKLLPELKGLKVKIDERELMTVLCSKFPEGPEGVMEGLKDVPTDPCWGWRELLTLLEKTGVIDRYRYHGPNNSHSRYYGKTMVDLPEIYRLALGCSFDGGVKRKKDRVPDQAFYSSEPLTL